jgi:hypothetical protein
MRWVARHLSVMLTTLLSNSHQRTLHTLLGGSPNAPRRHNVDNAAPMAPPTTKTCTQNRGCHALAWIRGSSCPLHLPKPQSLDRRRFHHRRRTHTMSPSHEAARTCGPPPKTALARSNPSVCRPDAPTAAPCATRSGVSAPQCAPRGSCRNGPCRPCSPTSGSRCAQTRSRAAAKRGRHQAGGAASAEKAAVSRARSPPHGQRSRPDESESESESDRARRRCIIRLLL